MKYRVEHSGECKTYAALHHTACHLLDRAKSYEDGSLLQLQACAVFCAFTFEAFLNHVGRAEIEYWDEIERVSYRSKLNVIAGHLHFQVDPSRSPFQTVIELFRLRDVLAHGRTSSINEVFETNSLPPHDSCTRVMPWEKLTLEQLESCFADVKAAIEKINGARGIPDTLLWNQGGRSRVVGSAAPKSEQAAPANGGPGESSGNSGASGAPPSVS